MPRSKNPNIDRCPHCGRGYGPVVQFFGKDNSNSRLTNAQVRQIKKYFATGGYTVQAIADHYGMSTTAISAIKLGQTWKHIK